VGRSSFPDLDRNLSTPPGHGLFLETDRRLLLSLCARDTLALAWQVIVRNIGLVAYGEERESGPPTQAIAARIAVHHPCNRNPGAGAEPDF
jgi:hypothetical protein